MEYELTTYQYEAVEDVLRELGSGLDLWRGRRSPSQFALSAMTGSGKTVIATAAIEALLYGSPDFGVDADPSIAVVWITDDPALNRQTKSKMLAASNRLQPSQLVELGESVLGTELSPGHVYFLNTQKLSRTAKLAQAGATLWGLSFWEVLRNTIESRSTNLVMILDEAHRGMRRPTDRSTIVLRLINGDASTPAMPIVWGISATIDRFTKAMEGATQRVALVPVVVDVDKIRASGLVKDVIGLDQPDETGTHRTTLLRDAVQTARLFDTRWAAYSDDQREPPVVPLLVVQVPDRVSAADLAVTVQTVEAEWPDLGAEAIAHVFGEHEPVVLGSRTVPWVPPESIQDEVGIRVVLAKEAISTGWDCPRAEVLYSDRPASDATHIAQVIGRMVRQPLAHRVETDDLLNSVSCYLPLFDRRAVEVIKGELEGRESDGQHAVALDVVRAPTIFDRNATIDARVFDVMQSLPSVTVPDATASPLRRAKQLAKLLADDAFGPALLVDADATLTKALHARLDGLAAELADDVASVVADLRSSRVRMVRVDATGRELGESTRELPTHAKDLDRDTKRIVHRVKEGVGKTYFAHRSEKAGPAADLLAVRTEVAALFSVDKVAPALDLAATAWVQEHLDRFSVSIKNTAGAARAAYRRIQESTSGRERIDIELPFNERGATKDRHGDDLTPRRGHLFSDPDGMFPAELNDWEKAVIDLELLEPSFVAWYRNPSRSTPKALRIAYEKAPGKWSSLQPDFVVFSKVGDGIGASIVDPHGTQFSDAKPKLLALADYAEQYGDEFVRIESVAAGSDGKLHALDLKLAAVRDLVRGLVGDDPSVLFDSPLARTLPA